MKAFVECLLSYNADDFKNKGQIFGHISGYYGCDEAQSHGSLHCHMLLWQDGVLNLNEIKAYILQNGRQTLKQQIIQFLNEAISSSISVPSNSSVDIPSNHVYPCSIQRLNGTVEQTSENEAIDFHNVV